MSRSVFDALGITRKSSSATHQTMIELGLQFDTETFPAHNHANQHQEPAVRQPSSEPTDHAEHAARAIESSHLRSAHTDS